MKNIFPLAMLAMSFSAVPAVSQAQIFGKSVPSYTSKAGTTVHKGDTLHLGRGTLPTGEFQFIYVPANVLTGSAQVNFSSQLNNRFVVVKDVRQQESKLYGSKTVAVIKANTINGCVDIDGAEQGGEIITANTRKGAVSAAGAAAPANGGSTADELAKLKKLYDQKVLTKEEYEGQKAKLLR